MTHPAYDKLHHMEKIIFMTELIHAVQSDPNGFELATKIIQDAREAGYFEGVTILPAAGPGEPQEPT